MAADFDPYYTWLGIAPEEQPPNHYRLLGIRLFEDNPEVISNVADRQMAHLRTFQTGVHAAESQRLLNEVAAARVCLLKPEKKAVYDAELRARLPQTTSPASGAAEPEPALDPQLANVLAQELAPHSEAHTGVKPAKRLAGSRGPKESLPPAMWLLAASGVLAVAVLAVVFVSGRSHPDQAELLLEWAEAERQGAVLEIDQQPHEVAVSGPLAIALQPGEHRVRITGPSYNPFECSVLLRPDEKQTLSVKRRPQSGTLVMDWAPEERSGGALSVDGKPQAVSPTGEFRLKLDPGEHALRLTRTDCKPIEEQVKIKSGEETPLLVRWTRIAPSVPAVQATGPGIAARLFAKGKLDSPVLERQDRDILCVWDDGTPDARLPAGEYSIHWNGWLKAPMPGRYKFLVLTDGQAKLWLDERLLIDGTESPPAEVELDSSPHSLRLEYDGGENRGYVVLNWVPPLDKSPEQTVPAEALFLDRASAEQAAVAGSVLTPAPLEAPPSTDLSQSIDLLRRVDVAGHPIKGHWWFQGSSLLVCEYGERRPPGTLKLPVAALPAEYEVKVTVERLSGDDNVTLGLVAEGRRFDAVLDGWPPQCIRGVELVDGKGLSTTANPAKTFGRVLTLGKRAQLTYTVRRNRLTIACDGEVVFDWPAEYSRYSPRWRWGISDLSTLILRVHRGIARFSRIELIPLSSEPGTTMASAIREEPAKPPAAVQTARQAVPSEEKRQEVAGSLKEELAGRASDRSSFARLAWAAHLIQEARQREGKPAEQYVLLTQAGEAAINEGDCWLPLLAAEELGKRFEVSGVELKIKALAEAARHSRTTAALETTAELAASLVREALAAEAEGSLQETLEQLRQQAQKKRAAALAQAIQKQSARLEQAAAVCRASREALAASKTPAEASDAALKTGRYAALIEEDWQKALPLLAKSEDSRLSKPAAKLAADAKDAAAQMALADAWWEIAAALPQKSSALADMAFGAARYWYETALPRLAGEDLARVRGRLCQDGKTARHGSRAPFRVALHGLGGAAFMLPAKTSGAVRPEGGFATFQGNGLLEYAQVPSTTFIHELRLTLLAPQGVLDFIYGDPRQGARVRFDWDEKKGQFACQFQGYRGGGWSWNGERVYKPKQPLRFSVYVNENQRSLHEGDTPALGCRARPTDLQLRVSGRNNVQAVISQCEFRPWNRGEAERLNWPAPVSRVADARPQETALRLHVGNFDLSDRPNSREGKPFMVSSTGTPMQWIAPGSFQRNNRQTGPQPAKPSEVTISRGFWIGRYEVTQAEWTTLMGANPSRVTGSPFLPVDGVSWHEAGQFCQELTRLEAKARRIPAGYAYRLPTEAEWEYACRAGSQSDLSVDPEAFWHERNSGWHAHEVGQGKPNAWGLFDMHGNAEEWALDAWREPPRVQVLRLTDPVNLPQDKEIFYAMRGGAWWLFQNSCASGDRDQCESAPGGHHGFRLALAPAIGKSE